MKFNIGDKVVLTKTILGGEGESDFLAGDRATLAFVSEHPMIVSDGFPYYLDFSGNGTVYENDSDAIKLSLGDSLMVPCLRDEFELLTNLH